jgi:hypothetical protein
MPANTDVVQTVSLLFPFIVLLPRVVGALRFCARFTDPAAFSLRVQDSPLPGFSLSGESVSIVTELRE